MDYKDLKDASAKAAEWIDGYYAGLDAQPVRAQVAPGEIAARLPAAPPEQAVPMDEILADFARIVPDGLTHWQHPRFFAYFPANAAPAAIVAEQLVNAMSVQGMLWQTSPAATEIEQVMIDWLRQAVGLPDGFKGVLQDTASSATFSAVLTMRERALNFTGNGQGLSGQARVRIYCSDQVHSSVDKACWMAGIGQENLIKIPTGPDLAMDAAVLRRAIEADRASGHLPAGVIPCLGGTSVGASDDIAAIMDVAEAEGLYSHLDAAWAGNAMICPELRGNWSGAERCDSIVFNPYKWLGSQFDGSVQFLKDPTDQVRAMGIRPSYLETEGVGDIVNFSEWTVQLGRRFRSLKIWFLIRAYGLDGLRAMIRDHVNWAEALCDRFRQDPAFTITTEPRWSLFTFQLRGDDAATAALLQKINDDGRIYLTQTTHDGRYVIRVQVGQFATTRADVMMVYDVAKELSAHI